MNKSQFALDIYLGKVFKILMWLVPLLALFAGINFTSLKFLGYYEDVSLTLLYIFDGTNIIYCVLGAFFAINCQDKEKNLKTNFVSAGKIVISIVIFVQWNFISYMIPSRDFWAFFTLFIFVSIFFLDSKYVLKNIGIVIGSMLLSWLIKGDELLPVKDSFFLPDMILRCILIILVCTLMYLITFIIEKMLVRELENIAEFDSLTLLRNRRTLNSSMDKAISDFNETGQKFCFFMADIDDFKIVNDTYGHPFGDVVLKDISQTLIFALTDKAKIFRYGGEEICALLYTDINEGKKIVDDLRIALSKQDHIQDNINVKVTLSFGIMEYEKNQSKDDIIKIADANLYYAKSHGKNKVIS